MTYSLYLKCVYITLHQIGRNSTDTIASTLLVKVAREIINVFARLHHTYVKKQSTQQKLDRRFITLIRTKYMKARNHVKLF